MNVDDAAYHVVHDYPGGQSALGARIGMSGALLGNKVRLSCPTNVLALREAVQITGVSGDLRILQAWAAAENCRLVPIDGTADSNLVQTLLEQNEREGVFARVLRESMADGRISAREMADLEKVGGDVQGVMVKLLRQLKAMQAVAP